MRTLRPDPEKFTSDATLVILLYLHVRNPVRQRYLVRLVAHHIVSVAIRIILRTEQDLRSLFHERCFTDRIFLELHSVQFTVCVTIYLAIDNEHSIDLSFIWFGLHLKRSRLDVSVWFL